MVVGLAWGALVAIPAIAASPTVTPSAPPGVAEVVAGAWPMWVLMATAMMAPAAASAARHVAENSFRWRRQRAILTFLGGYVAAWALFGLVVITTLALVSQALGTLPAPRVVLLFALAVGMAWQVSPWKASRLSRCRTSIPLAPYGWRAFRSCLRFGARHGMACVGSCWALMFIMAVATTGHLWWSLALTGLVLAERSVPSIRVRPQVLATPGLIAFAFVAGSPDIATDAYAWICTLPLG